MVLPAGVDSNYQGLYNRLILYSPELPVGLAQTFVNKAYARILSEKWWSGLRKDTEIFINDPYTTGTITVTQGSTTVQGIGTAWGANIGPQVFSNGQQYIAFQLVVNAQAPFYDIVAVNTGAQTLTLDRPFPDVTQTVGYSLENVYLVMPNDFIAVESMRDMQNNWRLHVTSFRQSQLDIWDPRRTVTGTPWVMAAAQYDLYGNRRYEIWPRAASHRLYPMRYLRRPPLLAALTDSPIYPITSESILEGALSELAAWRGSAAAPNPYYDVNLHRSHEDRFYKRIAEIELEDENLNQMRITYEDLNSVPYAPIDARYLQTHDVPF